MARRQPTGRRGSSSGGRRIVSTNVTDEADVLDDTVDLSTQKAPTVRRSHDPAWPALHRCCATASPRHGAGGDRGGRPSGGPRPAATGDRPRIQHSTGVRGLRAAAKIFAAVAVLVSMFANRLAVVRPAQRTCAVRPAPPADPPHPSPQPRRPQRRAPRGPGRPRHERHRDAQPVLRGVAWRGCSTSAAGARRCPHGGLRLAAGARRLCHHDPAARDLRGCKAPAGATGLAVRNGEMMATIGELVSGAETIRAYEAGARYRGSPTPRCRHGRRRTSAPASSARRCSRLARCSRP